MKFWRQRGIDTALVLLVVVVLAAAVAQRTTSDRIGSLLGCTALVVLVLGRRRWPVPAAVVAFLAIGAAAQISPQANGAEFFAILATFGTVGTLSGRRAATTGWLVGCTVLAVSLSNNPYTQGVADVALTLTFCTVIWAAGLLVAQRGRQLVTEQARADIAESTRAQQVREATEHERSRIAAELHDIVSHGLSIVVVQSVAARLGLSDGVDRVEVDRRLDVVESTAREALADMRRMLGLLQTNESDDATEPSVSVGLSGLSDLAEQVRGSGIPVTLDVEEGLELPPGLDATCFRIVQESLTNVVKHAPRAPTSVSIHIVPPGIQVVVTNDAPVGAPAGVEGAGHGLIGMRQRADLYGGALEAGEHRGGFRVTATFPIGAEATRPRTLLRGRRRS